VQPQLYATPAGHDLLPALPLFATAAPGKAAEQGSQRHLPGMSQAIPAADTHVDVNSGSAAGKPAVSNGRND